VEAAAAPPQGGKMKRWMFFAAPVTVALILGLVVYALPASGSSTSLLSRVAKLEAQTKTLKASNTKLTKQVKSLNSFVAGCLLKAGVAPISVYGNPTAGEGYEYTKDNGVTRAPTTALDVTGQGSTPNGFAQLVDTSCVSSSTAAKSASSVKDGLRVMREHH
jgi:hypothetical protein